MTFGETVKKIREEKGLSQRQLGLEMGVKQQTIAQYEKAINTPKAETVRRLASALKVPVRELDPSLYEYDIIDLFSGSRNYEPLTIAAHFDGDEYTVEELEEIRKFAEFIKSKRKE